MAVRSAPPRSPKVPEIRKGDTVVVLAGKDAGKRGVVDQVIRRDASPSGSRSMFRRNSPAGGIKALSQSRRAITTTPMMSNTISHNR